LNVTVTREGVVVSGSGGKLARGCTTTAPGKVITVPAGMNGEHDWKALTTCVSRVKKQFEDETRVTLSADPEVPYEDLIAAMDAVRGDENELFPDVLLSAGIR
jgi:biopolymer transport protein TolR